jgi:hypothetical protein
MAYKGSLPLIELIRLSHCIPDRYDHFEYILKNVNLTGLYLELGVREGDSVNFIADIIAPQVIYGFDSFIGLPEEWKRKKDGSLTFPAGTFSINGMPKVRDNVILVQGWFAETLPEFVEQHTENIAFINIDSDIYRSAKTILSNLNQQIVPGTILYFDEITGWDDLIDRYDNWEEGEYKALVEWLTEFDREIEPISRNNRYGAAVRVIR